MPKRVEGSLQALDADAADADLIIDLQLPRFIAHVVVLPSHDLYAGDELGDLLVAARMIPGGAAHKFW